MADQTGLVFGLAVVLAYVYAFVGGFTDAANAIATSVGTRVLTPRAAVAVAGGFNLLGGLTGTAVALTIGKGLVEPSALSLTTVVAGLVGAMSWSLMTYRLGIPVSETHGLIGGLVGAGIATAGVGVIQCSPSSSPHASWASRWAWPARSERSCSASSSSS
jgi:PiT family inorganic phosphate transporter